MNWKGKLRNPRFRLVIAGCVALIVLTHWLWQPGLEVRDGRHDGGKNALWIGHGWLSDDAWFEANRRQNQKTRFRTASKIGDLAHLCAQNGVSDVFPHLCPTQSDGSISGWDSEQVARFLDNAPKMRVLPWIGGRLDGDARANSKLWRANFTASIARLLGKHPRLAGVHLNIEPWNSGDPHALTLLDEVRAVLPDGKILSVSAYPPRDWFYPFRRGWDEAYFVEVAARCDQMALMAYDSSVHDSKQFQWFVARWTQTSLKWAAKSPRPTKILIGAPTYADAGTRWGAFYHNGRVENLKNSLAGVHRGLSQSAHTDTHFQGIALYAEWETDAQEWKLFRDAWR